MRTPGFHATRVFAAPASHFHVGKNAGQPQANTLQPAAAIYIGGRFICNGEVTPNGYINCYPMGGGGERCRPACGPCQSDPDSPTGRSRFCLRANCDDYTRPC
jgi:hypothetical protein